MSQTQSRRWAIRAFWFTLATLVPIGCNLLVSKSESQPKPTRAEYPLTLDTGPSNDQRIHVAIFLSGTLELTQEYEGIEGRLGSLVATKLQQLATETKQEPQLQVVDPTLVNKYKKKNPNWNTLHASQWGHSVKADFVLDIHLDKMSLYQPGTSNQFYGGYAEVAVDVYEVRRGIAEPRFKYVLVSRYPKTGVLEASSVPLLRFQQEFLQHLATELAEKHVPCQVDSQGPSH
jgi:hypothetical protein